MSIAIFPNATTPATIDLGSTVVPAATPATLMAANATKRNGVRHGRIWVQPASPGTVLVQILDGTTRIKSGYATFQAGLVSSPFEFDTRAEGTVNTALKISVSVDCVVEGELGVMIL